MSEVDANPAHPWYADGLRFECTMCGNCCTGPPGAVWFDKSEGEAMAAALGIDIELFNRRFVRQINGKTSLRERRTKHGFDCILLDRTSQPGRSLCRVYRARPAQCRGWPFWPENLKDPVAWAEAKRTTPCPGMNSGQLIPADDIVKNLRTSTEAARRCADPDF